MNDGIRKCNDVKVTERLIYINLWMAKLHKETELAKLYAMIFKYLTLCGGTKTTKTKRLGEVLYFTNLQAFRSLIKPQLKKPCQAITAS